MACIVASPKPTAVTVWPMLNAARTKGRRRMQLPKTVAAKKATIVPGTGRRSAMATKKASSSWKWGPGIASCRHVASICHDGRDGRS